eukprot:2223786-Pyramimonas_sp.AAC.1
MGGVTCTSHVTTASDDLAPAISKVASRLSLRDTVTTAFASRHCNDRIFRGRQYLVTCTTKCMPKRKH